MASIYAISIALSPLPLDCSDDDESCLLHNLRFMSSESYQTVVRS